ncbi:MAG: PEP-CTERM sorting domain-containing protein [Planctomycetota bacterium]|nr:PEP-CTERM sorting domain-containing protein [Planctomycetota bacterium]
MNPKTFQAVTFIACMIVPALCSPALAAVIKQIDVDEYGHLLIQYQNPQTNPDVMVTGVLAPDTGLPGSTGLALTYILPFTPSAGDVVMREKQSDSTVSDVLRFVPAGFVSGVNVDRLLFYSDNSDTDPTPGLADTGLPGALISIVGTDKHGNPITISPMVKQEDASETSHESKAVWTPSDNNAAVDPGFFANEGQPFKYTFYSEGLVTADDGGPGVPEPATLSLLTMGAIAMVIRLRRRV